MTTFVLVPGAGGSASYWSLVSRELTDRGHQAIAVDIREDDPALGLPEYADIVEAALDGRPGAVLVAQSLGGFTAPVVASRVPVAALVLVNAMIPAPGERPGEWWDVTGATRAREEADARAGRGPELDTDTHFLHDVDPQVLAALPPERAPAPTPFDQPCEFRQWPAVPIHVLVGRDDRLFPASFQQWLARTRLGVEADLVDGGHLVALSNPDGVTDRLIAYAQG